MFILFPDFQPSQSAKEPQLVGGATFASNRESGVSGASGLCADNNIKV